MLTHDKCIWSSLTAYESQNAPNADSELPNQSEPSSSMFQYPVGAVLGQVSVNTINIPPVQSLSVASCACNCPPPVIDTKNWTITVSRNIAIKGHFTPPKTECGNRTIALTDAAIQALKSQMEYTRLGTRHEVDVHLREFGKIRKDLCTFVFVPKLTARNGRGGDWYAPGSFAATWNTILTRAGIRHRRAYESRHTYACWALSAGANPNFIASQMGHTSAQMVYSVYGKWMTDNNTNQMEILNANFGGNAPLMPQAINQ